MDDKCDPELGLKVNEYLTAKGINTPMVIGHNLTPQEKVDHIEGLTDEMLRTLGLDLEDDSLAETPRRVAKMYVNEIFSGLRTDTFPKCTRIENKFVHGEEFVSERNITLFSDCEHHLRPIIGVAHVAYIPRQYVLGLSKMNRIVHYFARRPQVQERLNEQIAHTLAMICDTPDVIVMIEAGHTCVSQRGVQDTNSTTATLTALGAFAERESHLRREFVASVTNGRK